MQSIQWRENGLNLIAYDVFIVYSISNYEDDLNAPSIVQDQEFRLQQNRDARFSTMDSGRGKAQIISSSKSTNTTIEKYSITKSCIWNTI